MRPIGIVTDSHSGISQEEAARLGIMVLPMPFYFDEECYYEDVTLSREEFFEKNQEALDRAKGIEELEIHLGEKGECYEQYCSFLNNTMSKYVIFYNEKNIFCSFVPYMPFALFLRLFHS